MVGRTIEIGTPGTRLSVRDRQLVIDRPQHGITTVPVEDLAMVIIDTGRITLTQAVVVTLMEAKAVLLATGPDHLPVATGNTAAPLSTGTLLTNQAKTAVNQSLGERLV